jgi:hypothetical protein
VQSVDNKSPELLLFHPFRLYDFAVKLDLVGDAELSAYIDQVLFYFLSIGVEFRGIGGEGEAVEDGWSV